MTLEEIKCCNSMHDILDRYGLRTNRAGFVSCPFHKEKTASMKIYKDSYYCFGCGASGDIFTFIQKMDNCDFKTAFYSLGGTYEKQAKSAEIAMYRAQKSKERRKKKEEDIRKKKNLNNMLIGTYVVMLKKLEPLSEPWCYCMNEYTKCLGMAEYLEEMEGGETRWSY